MSEQAASWDMMDCTKQNGNNMANAKQVLDVHVSKGITVAQSNEHMRNWTEKGLKRATDLGNYDPTREHLNFEVVSGGKIRPIDKGRSIPERMAELLHKRGIKDPNEGLEEPRFRTVVNIIFGGARTRMQELAFGKQEGDFEKGDLVRIMSPEGQNLGVGRTAYSCEEAARVIGQHDCKPLVHYDYLYLE